MATDAAPAWLITARVLKGTLETPGSADNPVIMDWRGQIAQRFPETESYTKEYLHDSIAWCGLFVAFCVSAAGIKPPFGPADTDKFLWANSWSHNWGIKLDEPRLGCICVFTRNGGGHVAFYEGEDGDHIIVTSGNQHDSVSTIRMAKSQLTGFYWPPLPEKLPTAVNIAAPAGLNIAAPSAASRFSACLPTTLKWEGGNDDDPRDPGGRTSRGILQTEWDVWRLSHPGLPSDVWKAPQDQVVAIYQQKYWDRMLCEQMPPGVDLAVFDFGVNSGKGVKVVQKTVGTDPDNEVGPLTLAALASKSPTQVINDICDARLAYLRGLGVWDTFGNGWTNRVKDVRATALTMTQEVPPVFDTPTIPTTTPTPMSSEVIEQIADRVAEKIKDPRVKQAWGAVLMAGIKAAQIAFPQFAVFGSFAQLLLTVSGFMGTPVGEAATATGTVTAGTFATLLASWAVSKVNRVTK